MVGILYSEAEKGRQFSDQVRTDSRTAQTKRVVEETPKKATRKRWELKRRLKSWSS